MLDARGPGETRRGDRSLALSHGARLILDRLGVWDTLVSAPGAATPITRIDVSQAGGFGRLELDAAEHGLPALGYVVSYRALQAALDAALAETRVTISHGVTVNSVGGTPAYAAVVPEEAHAQPLLARLAAVADGTGAAVCGNRARASRLRTGRARRQSLARRAPRRARVRAFHCGGPDRAPP